jgi:two-component system, NarL family, nitrate/nitrite sensor histidine kinase NarX
MRPLLKRMQTQPPAERTESTQHYLTLLPAFIEQTNQLVLAIEAENARATAYLRASQFVLIGLILAGSVAIIYLLYGWIIRPIEALRDGISKMAAHNFDIQIPVEDEDKFGELAVGFNNMAAQLKDLYTDLENKVAQKIRQLAQQNRELSTLYDFSAYLSQPGELEQHCGGFLAKLIEYFGVDGGTVLILNPRQNTLHLAVHQGLSLDFIKQEQCLKANDCLC